MADQNNRVECRMIGGVCACTPGSCVVGLAAPAFAAPAVPAVDALTRIEPPPIPKYSLASKLEEYASNAHYSWKEYTAAMKEGGDFLHALEQWAERAYSLLATPSAAPADPEQAALDSLAQAGLAAALENRAKGEQSNWHVMPPFAAPAGLLCIDRKQLGSIVTDLLMDGARAKSVQFRDGVTFGVLGLHEKTLALAGVQPSIAGPAKGGNTKPDSSNLAAPEATSEQHPDDIAVDKFAAAMKDKMAKSRAKGRGGWDNPEHCSADLLRAMLLDHIHKGDPVDVGNFAMMLFNLGGGTTPRRAADASEQMGGAQVAKAENELRHAFEAAARKGLPLAITGVDFRRDDDGDYQWAATRRLFEFWKTACGFVSDRAAEGEATERKPLTDAEIVKIATSISTNAESGEWFPRFVKAIEQHHGITGGGK